MTGEENKKIKIIYIKYKTKLHEIYVDDEDYDMLNKYKWHLTKPGYVYSTNVIKNKKISMHRLIMNPPSYMDVDHKDHNKQNNQKFNLRICTHSENMENRLVTELGDFKKYKYKGVTWQPNINMWKCRIFYGKTIILGYFINELAAANCYDYWAKYYFGEFAKLNNCSYMEKEEWENFKYKTKFYSNYLGVTWDKKKNKWFAQIWRKELGKKEGVGYYNSEIDAARAWDKRAIELRGKDTKLNFIY